MERITSRQNPIVNEFRALVNPKARLRAGDGARMLLDGMHLVEEALESGVTIDVLAIREGLAGSPAGGLAQRAAARGARVVGVTDAVLSALSPVRESSGIVAIARGVTHTLEAALSSPPQLVLMLSDVQDPGNMGAIVRVADACGATGIITSEASADPFGWKALRGSMGSTFHLPVAARQSLAAAARLVRQRGIRLYAAVPRAGTPLPRCDLRRASAVMLGSEGAGLPGDLLELADERLTIPMRRQVESLNVATAAALVAYEAQRQREEAAS